jgi:hypothetical protein
MTRRMGYATYFLASIVVLSAATASAQNDMCVPSIGGLAGTPTVDGIVDGYTPPPMTPPLNYDAGWNQATRWNLSGNHGGTTATKLQAGVAGGFLYLSYVVDTPVYGQDNTIVIAFSQTGKPASTNWRIIITPSNVANPPNGAGKAPFAVNYWRDGDPMSGTYWNKNQVGTNDPMHWTYTNTKWSRSTNRWALEIKIPLTTSEMDNAASPDKVYLPASGPFRFYTAVFNAYGFLDPMAMPMVIQDPWPAGADTATGDLLQNLTPDPANWGQMSFNLRPACTGVSITWAGIGVRQPPGGPAAPIISEIRRFAGAIPQANIAACSNAVGPTGPVNEFIAKPSSTIMPGPAPGVFATFRLANWGIAAPQDFDKIGSPSFAGVLSNPTPLAGVPAGNMTADLVATWSLSYEQSCQYKFHPHQCIQVDVDSNDLSVRFLNKSVQRNMDFVPLSKFEQTAHISGDWGKVLGRDLDVYHLAILVETDQQFTNIKPPASVLGPCDRLSFRHEELVAMAPKIERGAQLAWIARGILLSDDTIIINGRKYRKGIRVGDFGYVGTHAGTFNGWTTSFKGGGLRPVPRAPGLFMIDVPRGTGADVVTVLEAVERRQPVPPIR